ncbi:hypothetical protein RhiirA4_424014 [Rhizophagus irregularis]|uniref:DUF6570 domain-containing protein n=1 Tax=Rhizophagus irregularis TaxID=588596 RepID=A0A2I1GVY0_9GLOM|nr:hypothetical protein RhiirA4_424014 [Rhizophagus irregularis]
MTKTNSDRKNQKNQKNQRKQAVRKRTRKLKNQNVLKGRNINQQTRQDHEGREIEETYVKSDNTDSDSHPTRNLTTTMSEEEISMLQDFRIKMDNIRYNLCNVCQERIPLLTLVKKTCDVPDELKGLNEIEEMFISQVFTVMTVYRLRGRQNGYRGHVINFSQDIQDFTKQLLRDLRSLDILVVRWQSSNNSMVFRDFTVRRSKVCKALLWLKENNPYYEDIIIDTNILQSLPENDSIFNMLSQLQDDESGEDNGDNIEDEEDVSRTFVPLMP